MAFNVQENAVFIHEFSTKKNLPTVGGGNPLPQPTPSLASLPRLPPPPPPDAECQVRHWAHQIQNTEETVFVFDLIKVHPKTW